MVMALQKVAANNNGNSSRDGKAIEQAHQLMATMSTLESRPPQKLRQKQLVERTGKATASATERGTKGKSSSLAETTSSATTTKAYESFSVIVELGTTPSSFGGGSST
jgi:hypothetical protein